MTALSPTSSLPRAFREPSRNLPGTFWAQVTALSPISLSYNVWAHDEVALAVETA